MNRIERIILVVVIIILLIGGLVYAMRNRSVVYVPAVTGCTMEAKICPDGSSVGRVGPSCEFESCPDVRATESVGAGSTTTTTTTTTYTTENTGNMYNQTTTSYGNDYIYPNNETCGVSNIRCASGYYPICSVGKWFCAEN